MIPLSIEKIDAKDIIALSAFSLSLAVFITNLYFQRKAKRANTLFGIFTESRKKELRQDRDRLGELYYAKQNIGLDQFREYATFLNHMGLLLHHNYVEPDEIFQLMGGSIIFAWKALGPAILARRQEANQATHYLFHFQYLHAQMLRHRAEQMDKIMSLIRESEEIISTHSGNTL